MVSAEPSATMDVLKEGIKAVAVGVGGSKPIPEDLVAPLIQVRTRAHMLTSHNKEHGVVTRPWYTCYDMYE